MNRRGRAALALLAALVAAGCGGEERRGGRGGGPTTKAGASTPTAAAADHAAAPALDPAAAAPSAHLFDRVAVLGASVSAGLAAPPVATSIKAGLPADAAVLDVASVLFFQDPFANGRAQVDAALAHRPTVVVALDFLFWFAYADASPAERRARLDAGLALLAPLPGTLLVGDLPDMRNANPRVLGPAAVPSPDELAALDDQIRRWAAARPHTLVLPLAAWTAPLVTGADIELAPGEQVPARDLMFFDGLHANALGTWHLLDLVDHTLERELAVPADALRLVRP
jgi:hypothetical protein